MARQYFGSVPIISVSPGHFSRTDMAASRDQDLVKMREIRNTKFEPRIISLLSNRFQVGLRENPHGKIFQNWSLYCYHKINPILDVSHRSKANLFTSEISNCELLKFSVICLQGSLEQVVCSNCWLLRSAVSQWGGEGRATNPRKHRPTNTNTKNTNISAVQIQLLSTGWFLRSLQCTAVKWKPRILLGW